MNEILKYENELKELIRTTPKGDKLDGCNYEILLEYKAELQGVQKAKKMFIEMLDKIKWDTDKRLFTNDKWGLKYCKDHNKDLSELKQSLEDSNGK